MWLAPEVLRNIETPDATKIDVYAFGVSPHLIYFLSFSSFPLPFFANALLQVILYEIATRKEFFGEENFMTRVEEKVIKGERPPIPSDCPSILAALTEACWDNGIQPLFIFFSFLFLLFFSSSHAWSFRSQRATNILKNM